MSVYPNFRIVYNPDVDTSYEISRRIAYSLTVKRLKSNKPCVMFICGASGEGKSLAAITWEELILTMQGVDIREVFDDINIYTPLEYPTKIRAILNEPRLKDVNVVCIHEAREVIRAKNWQSFLTQAIADINALSRSIKPLCIIIVSQSIRDITSDVRYTINYYMPVKRHGGNPSRLSLYSMWTDDRNMDKIQLRKKRVWGYLKYPDGRQRPFYPLYFELNMPPRDLVQRFNKSDTDAKTHIINKKMNKLLSQLKAEFGEGSLKVDEMVKYYSENMERMLIVGKMFRGTFRLKDNIRKMHELTELEEKEFGSKLENAAKEKGFFGVKNMKIEDIKESDLE